MKAIEKKNVSSIIGVLLSIPAIYFIFIAVMKYAFGWNYLFDAAAPVLERLGIKESLGWNINLLILFGPLLAFILNALSVISINFEFTKDRIDCRFSLVKSWQNLVVIIFSGGALMILFAYLLGENCVC